MTRTYPREREIVLKGDVDEFRIGIYLWSSFLLLAEEFGWEPRGTVPPDDFELERWGGGYWEDCGQRVVPEDAKALRKALVVGVHRVPPSEDMLQHECPVKGLHAKRILQDFIKFCGRSRGFTIGG